MSGPDPQGADAGGEAWLSTRVALAIAGIVHLARRQLLRNKSRLAIAVAGVGLAAFLMLMQLGFRSALFESSVRFHRELEGEIFLLNPQTTFLAITQPFPRQRLRQALGAAGVVGATPIWAEPGLWQNPQDRSSQRILVVGLEPERAPLGFPGVAEGLGLLRRPETVLFDASSRKEMGPVVRLFEQGPVHSELFRQRVTVVGLFRMGTSFGINGCLLTSDETFARMFPTYPPDHVTFGALRLAPGVDPRVVQAELRARLPDDVECLTREEFVARELKHWRTSTPVGFIFSMGVVIGFVVGSVVVYQILHGDVSECLPEYATLKAMGYSNLHLTLVVVFQAVGLAVLGFIPGWLGHVQVNRIAADATQLPLEATTGRSLFVLGLTVLLCAVAASMAVRTVRRADPATVF